jgi:hypothetical protein
VNDERTRTGGVDPRDPRELEDAGPAMRISEQQHAAGPAFQAEWGRGAPLIEGPSDDGEPGPIELRSRARMARREVLYGAVGIALLLLVAAVSFWASGSSRGDSTLQMLGVVFVAVASGVVALGIYLSRAD